MRFVAGEILITQQAGNRIGIIIDDSLDLQFSVLFLSCRYTYKSRTFYLTK